MPVAVELWPRLSQRPGDEGREGLSIRCTRWSVWAEEFGTGACAVPIGDVLDQARDLTLGLVSLRVQVAVLDIAEKAADRLTDGSK